MARPPESSPPAMLDSILADQRDPAVPWATRRIVPVLLRGLRRREDGADWGAAIGRLRQQLQMVDRALEEVQVGVDEAALRESPQANPAAWLAAQKRLVDAALGDGDGERATGQWLDAWTAALAAGALEPARSIVTGVSPGGDDALVEASLAVLDRLDADPRQLAESAEALTGHDAVAHAPRAHAILGMLRIRSLMEAQDDTAAERAAQALVSAFAGSAREHSRALAVRAEVELRLGRVDDAHRASELALLTADAPSDCYVAAGLVAEAEEAWVSADRYYGEAVARGASGVAGLLRAPSPARLKVADARQLGATSPGLAAELYEAALRDGIPGEGSYSDTDVKVELARILESSDPEPAASWFADAASDCFDTGRSPRAVELYRAAVRLRPDDASLWWYLAESLRLSAIGLGGWNDLDLVSEGLAALEEGYRCRAPQPEEAWVLVTQALLEKAAGGADLAQVELIERALLMSETYRFGYVFLADAYADLGFLREAGRVAEQGGDEVDGSQLARLQLATGEYERVIRTVQDHVWFSPNPDDLRGLEACAHLRLGRPDAAAEVLDSIERTPWTRMLRCFTFIARAEFGSARREFAALHRAVRGDDELMEAWAGSQSGDPALLEHAIALYRERVAHERPMSNDLRDLGLMLLARGDVGAGDLADGERLLRDGVAVTTSADDLIVLRDFETALVRDHVRGDPHEAAVRAVLDDLDEQILARRDELLSRDLDPSTTAWHLSQARTALAEGRPGDALGTYRRLAQDSGVREWTLGAERAEDALLAEADELMAQGLSAAAEASLATIDAEPHGELRAEVTQRVRLRHALAACILGELDDAAPLVRSLLTDSFDWGDFASVTSAIASQPADFARLRNGLLELGSDGAGRGGDSDESRMLTRLVESLPYGEAYRLNSDTAYRPAPVDFVPSSTLEVRIGRTQHDLVDSEEIRDECARLRADVLSELGVEIQDIRISPAFELDGLVEIRVFGDTVDLLAIEADTDDPAARIIERLELAVRQQVHRLLGPDDLLLWWQGWALAESSSDDGRAHDVLVENTLGLTKLLRRLLREGVSIRRRQDILDVLIEDLSREPGADVLRAMRLALRDEIAASAADSEQVALPAELEAMVSAGWTGANWELGRADSAELSARLDDWLADQPARLTIAVRDERCRAVLWRLLAATQPRVRVVAQEELA